MTMGLLMSSWVLAQDKINSAVKVPFDSSQIKSYSANELINYLTIESLNWHFKHRNEQEINLEIVPELIRRKDTPELLRAFEHPKDDYQKEEVMNILYQIDDSTIFKTMKKYANPTLKTTTMYYCLNYLAKRGDIEALSILNDNYFSFPVSSLQLSYTAELFGRFKYKPATNNLIISLGAMVINLAEAALESLQEMYPDAPRDFESFEEAQKYFKEYLNQKNKQ